MPSKRDLFLIRLAIRWRWLSADEGEDCLFLKRKFGDRLSIDEIIRRRGYLEDEAISTLVRTVESQLGPTERDVRRESKANRAKKPARQRTGPVSPIVQRIESQINDARTVCLVSPFAPEGEATQSADEGESDEQGATVIAEIPDSFRRSLNMPRPPSSAFDDDEVDSASAATTIVPFQYPAAWDLSPPAVSDAESRPSRLDEPTLAGSLDAADGPVPHRVMTSHEAEVRVVHGVVSEVRSGVGIEPHRDGRFGNYRLESLVKREALAEEYVASAIDAPERRVRLEILTTDPWTAARYVQACGSELIGAARIDSPNVARILDVGRSEGRYFVARELVEGTPLDRLLAARLRTDLNTMLGLARQLAGALAAARQVGVVHGALRPSNILVTPEGDARVLGFGRLYPEQADATAFGYLAPEQMIGGPVDHRSDLYALGATLYHLTLGVPLPHCADEAEALAYALEADPPDVRAVDPTVPVRVAAIVERLLAREPAHRYQTAEEAIDAIDQAIFDQEVALAVPAEQAVDVASAMAVFTRSVVASAALATVVLVVYWTIERLGLAGWSSWAATYVAASFGGVSVLGALTLLGVLALIRRGDLPLPISSAWLVVVRDGLGAFGALWLLAGFVIAPPAILNLIAASLGFVTLVSWVYGNLLRRRIALARPDRGVGRVLAVLGDPMIAKWARVHVPMHAVLASASVCRWAFLAYFSAAR
ncbi:MAG: protein kinase [Deltaproteobacteria bacterium]|nr:protein kinase [Deltaproteobacteria bacterium]